MMDQHEKLRSVALRPSASFEDLQEYLISVQRLALPEEEARVALLDKLWVGCVERVSPKLLPKVSHRVKVQVKGTWHPGSELDRTGFTYTVVHGPVYVGRIPQRREFEVVPVGNRVPSPIDSLMQSMEQGGPQPFTAYVDLKTHKVAPLHPHLFFSLILDTDKWFRSGPQLKLSHTISSLPWDFGVRKHPLPLPTFLHMDLSFDERRGHTTPGYTHPKNLQGNIKKALRTLQSPFEINLSLLPDTIEFAPYRDTVYRWALEAGKLHLEEPK